MSILEKWPVSLGPAVVRGQVRPAARRFDIERHIEATLGWIVTARAHARDGGIPAYFDLLRGRWTRSYPETTGYTIPTLLACSARFNRPELRRLAVQLADYLLSVRTAEGGAAHWDLRNGQLARPIVFDTGQVIFGWLAVWCATRAPAYLGAAIAAAKWLVNVQDAGGAWHRYQHLSTVKTIDARVAWALLEVDRVSPDAVYVNAARRNLDWVLAQQQSNGWFRYAGFRAGQDPFTHTIAYTAEGLFEAGVLLGEVRYISAAEQVARVMLSLQQPNGALASSFGADWRPTRRSSCLTGNCQMALLWLRFYERTGELAFLQGARRAVAFVAGTQNLTTSDDAVRGAIGGSFPIYGAYERMKYPNWAAKFFVDALLALDTAERMG